MYNCLKFCRRFLNSFSLETVDQVFSHNGRIHPKYRISFKYYSSVSSTFKMNQNKIDESISNFDELVSYMKNIQRLQVEKINQFFTTIKDENLTENQVLLLLEGCNKSIPSGNVNTKHELCTNVLEKFQKSGKFSEKVYETYLHICTQNKQCLNAKAFISCMGDNATRNLLRLLFYNVCECGDPEEALVVLGEMKKRQFNLDERIFNYLILAHTIKGGLSSGLKIVETMKRAKFEESSETLFFLIKGLAQNKDKKMFSEALEKYRITYSEDMIISLLESLGLSGNHSWVNILRKKVDESVLSRYFTKELGKLCLKFVHNGKYDAAFKTYETFVDNETNSSFYGGFILEEMLLCSVSIEKILEYVERLKKSGLNIYSLENVTYFALRNKMFSYALKFLNDFSTVRPHYFWPLLIEAHARKGELGLLETVQSALDMSVKFDNESLNSYIFPRFDLTNPQRVIKLFQEFGYNMRSLLTPMIIALMKKREFTSVLQLCETYKEIKIDGEEIISTLSSSWLITSDHKFCLNLLQRVSESSEETLLAQFLISVVKKMYNKNKIRNFIELLKEIKNRNMSISSATADFMLDIINEQLNAPEKIEEINSAINDILDFSKIPTVHLFKHPKNMTIEELELHLIELKNKNMETRGVLRKLIQKYAGKGNPGRVKELREELSSQTYAASPGMKSAFMHSHVQNGELEEALEIYEDLTKSYPYFRMDNFKSIDLARLLVLNDRFEEALAVVKKAEMSEYSSQTFTCLRKNCLNLLKSIKDLNQQHEMFNVLLECRLCEPSNIILGAIVQLHMEKDTLENTVDLYVKFCNKYGKTPMQVVVLSKVVEAGNEELLQKVLDASASIHGNLSARCSLVAAMCEQGLSKQVVTVLQGCDLNPTISLEKRCERWVMMDNMEALQTLLLASKELPPKLMNVPKIKLSIMQLYSKRNDCDGALAFWKKLVNEDDHIDTEVDNEFCELLSRCKFSSPENVTKKYKLE